ncbi:hypothetical protein CDAR_123071 [Caerostris darwini]|uniref:Ribosomal protein S14 n=1 Tax=Caerostris darwini TaxID=1538125 RepID=A0AAV4X6S5_9ARAC|nr:hypothetical protein CDAR_123071 [Caerostris darwini]
MVLRNHNNSVGIASLFKKQNNTKLRIRLFKLSPAKRDLAAGRRKDQFKSCYRIMGSNWNDIERQRFRKRHRKCVDLIKARLNGFVKREYRDNSV